jgi:hypothetical protein
MLPNISNAMTESSANTEEVPFEELVKELNSKVSIKDRIQTGSIKIDPFESLQIHFSLGLIQTVNSLLVSDKAISRLEDGVQLGLGIDLFSPEWVAEGLLKNYGRSTQNDSSLALREFDLRLSYLQQAPQNKMKFRLGNGLGARYLRYTNKWSGDSQFQTTPIYLLGFGLIIPVGDHFDFGVEVQGHLALINETMDRHGLSLILRLDNFF